MQERRQVEDDRDAEQAAARGSRRRRPRARTGPRAHGSIAGRPRSRPPGCAACAAAAVVRAQPRRNAPAQPGQQFLEVPGPRHGHRHVADGVLEDQVPADDPRDQFAERRVRVGVGRAGDRHHRRELGVAQRGEAAGHGRQDERDRPRPGRRRRAAAPPAAAVPIVEKMPAPTMAPIPSAVSCTGPSVRFRCPLPDLTGLENTRDRLDPKHLRHESPAPRTRAIGAGRPPS